MKVICTEFEKDYILEVLAKQEECFFNDVPCEERMPYETTTMACRRCLYKNIEWDIIEH